MNDFVVISSRQGPLIVDFEEKTITWERDGISANTMGLLPFSVNFSDITAIELREPTAFKLGCCNIIIRGKRYLSTSNLDITTVNVEKSNYTKMKEALQRVIDICGIQPFASENSIKAPTAVLAHVIHEFEIRKKCNQCNHTFCVSPFDIARNKSLAKQAKYSRMAAIGNVLGGTNLGAAVHNMSANNAANQIVDYNVCPACNSRNLSIISKEEYDSIAKSASTTNIPTVSAISVADELKKFKELLDMGVISKEEFDAKKAELLNTTITNQSPVNAAEDEAKKAREAEERRIEEERIAEERRKDEEAKKIEEEQKAEEERQRLIRIELEQKELEARRIQLERQAAEEQATLEKLKAEKEEKARIQREQELAIKEAHKAEIADKNKQSGKILKKMLLTTFIIFAAAFAINLIISLASSDNAGSDIGLFTVLAIFISAIPFLFTFLAIKSSYGINGVKKAFKFFSYSLSIIVGLLFTVIGIAMLVQAAFSIGIAFACVVAICISNIIFLKKTKKIG